jgi:hypothetical protein
VIVGVVLAISVISFLMISTAGCDKDSVEFGKVTRNPGSWTYLAVREARLREPASDAGIRDQRLDLTDAQALTYDTLDLATNHSILVAMPSNSQTMLVTGSIPQAAIPENRGKVLPVIVDRKIEIHFLTLSNGHWYSTNVLRTRIVTLTCSP